MTLRNLLASLVLTLFATAVAAGPAIAGGPLQSPWSPTDDFETWRMTAAFDMDRDTTDRADWTGWNLGDPTAGFGHAYDNHSGSDWGMVNGTPLYACFSGQVTALRESVPNDDHSDTGNYIIYNGDVGGTTYRVNNWHLAQNTIIPTSVGSTVTQGVQIADSNNTGNSTGPHLHFGAYIDDASGSTVCPYFNGLFTQDEFYYGDGRPCLRYIEVNVTGALNIREGTSTLYDIITSTGDGVRYVASQRNGWYRIFLPSAPATAHETRTSGGGVASSPDYLETGSWANSNDKSTVTDPAGDGHWVDLDGAGSRRVTAGSSATAQFVPTITQQGQHEIFSTWPAQANATGVTYTVNHSGGSTNVVIDQNPSPTGTGSGTHASPYIISTSHYVANHTNVGGDDIWNSYSPSGAGTPEEGPERIYQFTLTAPATVTATLEQDGYPTLDVDVQLLDTFSNTDCVARNDWSTSYSFGAGTHYIAIDSFGSGTSGDNRASAYTLTVDISTPMANTWISLGTYDFGLGQSAANGSVTIDASTASGAFVYADAIKAVPVTWRSAWLSDGFVTVLDGTTDDVCSVGVRTDATRGNDARSIDDIIDVPIYQGPDDSSPIVAKAASGQRFVCTHIWNDFYRISLPNSTSQDHGWISGEHLFIYNAGRALSAVPAELTVLGAD